MEDTASGIRVVCRFRPLNDVEKKENQAQAPFMVDTRGRSVTDVKRKQHFERFDTVLGHDASQQETYEATTSSLVEDVLAGFNAGVFAYGQSGGGKSYSLLGKEGQHRPLLQVS